MACGCGGCTGEDLRLPSAGAGVRASTCGCGGGCGGAEVAVNGEILRPGGLPPDVECGKGLPSGLLSASRAAPPSVNAPGRVLLETFGEIAVGEDGNMFFGLTECLRRSVAEERWNRLLLVQRSSSDRRCRSAEQGAGIPVGGGSGAPDPQKVINAMLGRAR